MRASTLFLLLAFLAAPLAAQEPPDGGPVAVEGRVRDDEGVAVRGASVTLMAGGRVVAGADTDDLGWYHVDGVPAGRYEVVASGIGYAVARAAGVQVAAGAPARVDLTLPRQAVALPGMRVEAVRSRDRERFETLAGATVRELTSEEVKAIPGVAEADPLRAIQVLPGVVSTSDFDAAFHVRGGSSDENLILLDGVPVFSPFHLGGFFSVFNADMVERAELRSGGFPARHGGRVSSVLQVESDPGNGHFAVDGGVSLLAARAAVAGGTHDVAGLGLRSVRGRVSFRRSYFDALLKPFFDFPYHLSDAQGVAEAWTAGGDRIRVTAYAGGDVLDLRRIDPADFPLRVDWRWGNDLAGVTWTRPRPGGGSLEVSAGATGYATRLRFPDFSDTDFRSRIGQAYARADLVGHPSAAWETGAGLSVERLAYHNRAVSGGTDFGRGDGTGWLGGGYGQALWQPPRWRVEVGARVDGWRPDPGRPSWQVAPRLAVKRFLGDGGTAVKLAAGRYTQFLHSLRNEEIPLGLDVWVLAGDRAPPVVSDQVQAGVERYFGEAWYASLEAYHRSFEGVVTFNPADDPNDRLDDILAGRGTSYGWDLLVRREAPSGVSGWLALSWLRARRTFPDALVPGDPPPDVTYPPVFDRRWDVDLVLQLPLPGPWSGGLRWNLGSGTPFTRPVGTFAYYQPRLPLGDGALWWQGTEAGDSRLGGYAVVLGPHNGARLPAYHRLDLSVRRRFEPSWGRVTVSLDVLNVYDRKNVLFYFYQYQDDPPVRSGISMFPVLPTLGVEVSF